VNGNLTRIHVIDSHTAGEPTRIIVSGGPPLEGTGAAGKLESFRRHHDLFRSAVVNEPRGSDVLVGGILVEPADKSCVAGVIFFNNVGYLGMCGHGAIGLIATLSYMGRVTPGQHKIETPVGVVTAVLHDDGTVSVTNVPSYRKAKGVKIEAPDIGTVTGDVAWGGNWFYLVENHGRKIQLSDVESLTDFSWRVRKAINAQGFPEVDHIELFGPPSGTGADSRNFVLCPGKAYDRSPCGTGTSAKLACLAADGKLAEGEQWIQESITGSRFTASYTRHGGHIIPTITGAAYVNAETTLVLNPKDPLCWGLSSANSPHGSEVRDLRA
jgi:4-hydroxyproline epimerase